MLSSQKVMEALSLVHLSLINQRESMNKTRLVIFITGFFFFSPALSSAGQSRAAGNSGGLSQIAYAGEELYRADMP